MIKQFIPAVIILVMGLAMGFGILVSGPKLESRPPESVAPLVRITKANPQRIQLTTTTHGTVAPRTESALIPEVSGSIVAISEAMVSGGFFKKGELLISIDARDYEENLVQAKAGLSRAASDLANAKRNYQRQMDLAEKQSTSAAQRDDALNRLRIAEATLSDARAKLSRATRDVKRTKLIAPYDGRVRSENVDVGQFVNRGTTVAILYAIDYAEVKLPILDSELAFLDLDLLRAQTHQSTPLRVVLRATFAGEAQEWEARIVRSEGELDARTRMIQLVARVDAPYAQSEGRTPLPVGLFVEAEIYGREVDAITVLPRSALRKDNQVIVVDSSNHLQFRNVKVLRISEDRVYVNGGLSAGDSVSISNLSSPLEGMLVRPFSNETEMTAQAPNGDAS